MPYARPPIGPLRFAPPQPPASWTEVRDATAFGPPAMQVANVVTGGRAAGLAPSEDCLTLNVWTPAIDVGRRPVLVWLYGGGCIFGTGSSPRYHGAALARRGDVVMVTINYRLGVFGYLRGIDVCGEALPTTGNTGLLDQRAALGWVRDEIAAFGGDPENVTMSKTAEMKMHMKYDQQVDAASVLLGGLIEPGGNHHKEQIDEDRLIWYNDDDGSILESELLNVRQFGVRLDDLEHRDELSVLFKEAGFQERDWSSPISTNVVRRRDRAAG